MRSEEALRNQASGVRKGRTTPATLREQVNPEAVKIYKEVKWPTPRALEIDESLEAHSKRMDKRESEGKETWPSLNLSLTTKNWATPVSRDSGSHTITENHPDGFNKNLVNDAITWPTPSGTETRQGNQH